VSLLVKIVVVEDILEDHELAIICKIYFHTMVCCQSLQRGKEMAGGSVFHQTVVMDAKDVLCSVRHSKSMTSIGLLKNEEVYNRRIID
jgi:hypothetical protein